MDYQYTCPVCGVSFVRDRARFTFCSHRCALVNARSTQNKPARIERTCKNCGKAFSVPPCYVGNGTHKAEYCSLACRAPAIKAAHRGKVVSAEQRARHSATMKAKPPRPTKPDYILECTFCHQLFTVPGKEHKRARAARFCGTACWYAYVRENPAASPTYRGGSFPNYGPDWPEQARQARERDGHTCQDCGKHQTRPALDVHHRTPRRAFKGDYRAANHLDNLVTLCKSCHAKRRE